LRLEPDEKPDVYLDLAFDDATVRFMKTLPPLSRARGKASLIGQRFLAVAERGTVQAPQGGALRVDGTSFEIANTRIKGGPAQVQLTAKGSVTSALSLLDQEPFRFLSKAGQTPDLAKGQADISGVIDFALKRPLPPSEIGFDIAGTVTDVRSETLVPGRPITADKLVFRAEPKRVRVSGAGRIDTVAFNGAWNMPIGQPGAGSEVTGQVELSQRFVERFNIGLPKGVVSGQTQGDITLSLTRDAPVRFAMTSNLDGLGLRFDPLGFRLGAGTRGALSVRGTLGTAEGTPPKIERITLDAPGLRAEGAVQINSGGTLDAARFDRVRAGDWLDGAVTLNGRGRNTPPAIVVSGGSVDLRKLPQSGGGGSGGSIGEVPLQVQLDQLQITQGIALNQFQGAFTLRGGGVTGGFTGRLNGTALVQGQTEARGARTAVQVTSGDAGRAISAAGFLKNAKDGAMVLDLAPADGAGSYNGRLEITNMRLREPPQALALLSVASGIGLLEQLDGKGLMFNEVSSRFRITPQTVIVSEGSAVGPSIGLSVDGYYDVASKNVDMQGVVSPLYALNAIGSIFTRKGEGLIGFNYTLKGLAANPRVQVNPLSLFTPGMFREIFRRPPPDLSQ
ncbi:MAG: AsmA-like C-terminal region-containing protein, partial [Pseudomonadota bacterium]